MAASEGNGKRRRQNDYMSLREEGFAKLHLMRVTLVREERNKSYKLPYFFFISASPGGNGTYITENAIWFKMEIVDLAAIMFAFKVYGSGPGTAVAPEYLHKADPTKSPFADGTTGAAVKTLKVNSSEYQGKRTVSVLFFASKENHVSLSYTPFEALAIADTLGDMIAEARGLMKQERWNRRSAAQHGISGPETGNAYQQGGGRQVVPSNPGQPGRAPQAAATRANPAGLAPVETGVMGISNRDDPEQPSKPYPRQLLRALRELLPGSGKANGDRREAGYEPVCSVYLPGQKRRSAGTPGCSG